MMKLPAGDPRNKIEYLAELVTKLGSAPVNLLSNALFRFIQRAPDSRTLIFPDVGGAGDNLIAIKSPAPCSMTTFDRWEFFVTHPSHSALVRQLEEGIARIGVMADEVTTAKLWQFCQNVPVEFTAPNQPLSLGIDLRNATATGGAYRVYVEAFDASRNPHRVFEQDVPQSLTWQEIRGDFTLSDPTDSAKPFKGILRFGVEMLRPSAGSHSTDELDCRYPFLSTNNVESMPPYIATDDFSQISAYTRSVYSARLAGVIGEGGVIHTQTIGEGLIDLVGASGQSNYYRMGHPNVVVEFKNIEGGFKNGEGDDVYVSAYGCKAAIVSEGGRVLEAGSANVTNIYANTQRGSISFELTVPELDVADMLGKSVWVEVDYHLDSEFKSAGFTLEL